MATIVSIPSTPLEDVGDLEPLLGALRAAGDITMSIKEFADSTPQMPAAAGSGSMSDLMEELKDIEKGPEEMTKNKKAPPATSVCVLPYDKQAAQENYQTLMDANSIVSLYTAIWSAAKREKAGHPEAYDITIASEAAQAFADQAACVYNVMSEGLAGYFNQSGSLQNTMNRKITKSNLHLEFLNEIFKGFNLGSAARAVLDGVLTKFVESVANFSVSTERTGNTVDQTLRILQCVRLNISGDDENPETAVYVYQPRIKIVYMRLRNSTWAWATKKADHSESDFSMQYTIVDFDLNINKFKASRAKLEKIWNNLSDSNLTEWSKKVTGKPAFEDPK